MKNRFTILAIFLFLSAASFSQTEKEIDAIFADINDPSRPAAAAVVLYKGEIIYKKGFGSKHLDYESLADTNTKFHMGGMSKHFTAFAIFLLEEQGKLSFEDDIRTYIPQLPEYDQTITIQHLLSLSSGLHGYWSSKAIAGLHHDDVFTHAQALKLISQQKELSYVPGTDYSYRSTDNTLLAEIVSKVSGQSFVAFMKDQLFNPLGMTNTLFMDDYEQYIPNIAESYEGTDNGYKKSVINYGIAGPTNLYSTAEDLGKWELNMINPKVGSKEMMKKLNSAATLSDGSTLDPLFGRVTLGNQFIHQERGIPKIYQTGSLGGYTSSIFKFLDLKFTVIVLSSGLGYNGHLGMQTAYLFLEEAFTGPAEIDFQSLKIKKLSAKKLEKHTGSYWNAKGASTRTIAVINDTLRYVRGEGNSSALIPLSENNFQMIAAGDEKIMVSFETTNNAKTMNFSIGESAPIVSHKYEPVSYTSNELQVFIGSFYCKELSTGYQFSLKDDVLTASHVRNDDIRFTPVQSNLFASNSWYFGGIQFERNADNSIKGFWLRSDRVRNLWFGKIN